jgi:hypothetical protein
MLKKLIITSIAFAVFIYVLTAFYNLSFDFSKWESSSRLADIVSLAFFILCAAIYLDIESQEKK